ncbi:MAG: hypothetical protein H7X97_10560 [Opitutaceae bacterium]|nr:hypothetical protein [Verrucomicrobiales bacterium]
MKTTILRRSGTGHGFILMVVLVLMTASVFIMASLMKWTSGSTNITERNIYYQRTVAAAEAATEGVIARMVRDFENSSINSTLTPYRALTPSSYTADPWINEYTFSDGQGNANSTYVTKIGATAYDKINSTEYRGLYGIVSNYRVVANARTAATRHDVAAGVKQDFQLATIPIFQFAIFYTLDLEINPSPAMVVSGKVHSNQGIYAAPVTSLNFKDSVTAAAQINFNRHTNDPQYGSSKVIPQFTLKTNYQGSSGVDALTLPIGTNSSPDSVREVINPPPVGEDPYSAMGRQRYYNKSDLIVVVTATNVIVRKGNWGGFAAITTNSGTGTGYTFIKTNASFYNGRELKTIKPVEIDVAALNTWISGSNPANSSAVSMLGHNLNSIYVNDLRTPGANQLAVRVINGQTLPPSGLTVSTKYPIYVKGHFNATDTTNGSTNTVNTKPASLVGDAINVLSTSWNDSNPSLATRVATDTTVNAAFIGGIVQSYKDASSIKHYSGGVENFPRFQENWAAATMTFNGSMVVMFPSKYATGNWDQTTSYYSPPTRKWAFDLNFLDPSRLPPGTPQVQKIIRGQWAVVAPNVVN